MNVTNRLKVAFAILVIFFCVTTITAWILNGLGVTQFNLDAAIRILDVFNKLLQIVGGLNLQ